MVIYFYYVVASYYITNMVFNVINLIIAVCFFCIINNQYIMKIKKKLIGR